MLSILCISPSKRTTRLCEVHKRRKSIKFVFAMSCGKRELRDYRGVSHRSGALHDFPPPSTAICFLLKQIKRGGTLATMESCKSLNTTQILLSRKTAQVCSDRVGGVNFHPLVVTVSFLDDRKMTFLTESLRKLG